MTALLWFEIMAFTLFIQLWLSLRVFRLRILCRGFDLRKCLSIKVRKHFPTSGPILAVFGVWGRFSVGEIVIVAALVEGILVSTFSFFKGFLVGRNF